MNHIRKLIIKNIGPLVNVDITLNKVNLIMGPQSTGKSCILKIASFCAWTEKVIELNQDERRFLVRDAIDIHLIAFHNLQGYFNKESFFAYETDTMKFSFSFKENMHSFEWKEGRWDYKRNKIAYIVAERNLLSVIPNWFELSSPNNSIRYFMKEWQNARNGLSDNRILPILNIRIGYEYDSKMGTDKIVLKNEKKLSMQSAST